MRGSGGRVRPTRSIMPEIGERYTGGLEKSSGGERRWCSVLLGYDFRSIAPSASSAVFCAALMPVTPVISIPA